MRLALTDDAKRFIQTEEYEIQQANDTKWKLRKEEKTELEISYSSISNHLCISSNFFEDYMMCIPAVFPTEEIMWNCKNIRVWKENGEEIKIDIREQ